MIFGRHLPDASNGFETNPGTRRDILQLERVLIHQGSEVVGQLSRESFRCRVAVVRNLRK